ncbi:hypothetical protein [Roseicyclus marinus]|uniref:hypothetical protein n=1 Tax=Roseicyclus marinus TaxID=2161673 RepID=UPI00240FC732|nr:hypothetical protein [Roseicyclus marinus]MDG3039833.1 hypothetical protein [Roseicyclus marinus]
MFMHQRTQLVYSLLVEYVRSPSLRHVREERSLAKLALEIVTELDRDSSVWKKWEGPREKILGAAIECWIPKADMLDFLNSLPGPTLTMTDLEQRMKCMIEGEYIGNPEPKLEAECLAIYQAEKEAGTEMPAIIGRLADYTIAQFQRLRDERRVEEERQLEEARLERERRLLSYADCPWTQIKGSKFIYCRKNGRVFKLQPNSDKSLTLYRVKAVDDAAAGELIGRYRSRGDASKVVAKAAYQPEPWR